MRVVLFDLRKAFDLIHHHVLARKLSAYDIPRSILCWIIFNGPLAKDQTEPRLLLGVGSCSCRGPTGDEIGPLAVPYHDK